MGRTKSTRTAEVTGSLVTFEKGAIASSSNKMKCNTKSSTETELVLLADKLSNIVWVQYFIECQGYNIDEYVLFFKTT
jgi:hypothetical protein